MGEEEDGLFLAAKRRALDMRASKAEGREDMLEQGFKEERERGFVRKKEGLEGMKREEDGGKRRLRGREKQVHRRRWHGRIVSIQFEGKGKKKRRKRVVRKLER